ncbi:hypothetical protein [Planctomycetes bacterium K23_9]|uniref:AsmA-like C-terminal domain-containing protein n=1 Tax=Stieleria marina TaxID=1930275 RepID=A0A517NP87_9BACT|nr:hypothetical protein K239x_08770 [Planctomycetes bacterium K23_9]
MHERTERAIARLLFVFCCAIPTFFTFAIVFVSWTPWYHNRQLAEIQARLSRETGLVVTVDDFEQISPYRMCLHRVCIHEPETNLEVAKVERITWICEDERIGVRIEKPELQSPQLAHAWQLVHDRFLCRPKLTKVPVKITANDLTIHSETGSMSMSDLLMWIKPRPHSVEATLQCLTPGRNRFPVNVTAIRDRSTDKPKTRWTLETGPTALPCSALAGYLPLLKRLGSDAEFTGKLTWESEFSGGWSVDLGGARFSSIDLGSVFEDLPHSIRGKADLVLDRCQIVPGQSVNLSGTVRSTKGWIRSSLLSAMENELGFVVDQQAVQNPSGEVFYELMALHFQMNGWDLSLRGACNKEKFYEFVRQDIALYGPRRELALSDGRSIAAIRLAHAIAPQHSEVVPISKQTAGLVELFVPPSQPVAPNEAGGPPSGNVRAAHWSDGQPIEHR